MNKEEQELWTKLTKEGKKIEPLRYDAVTGDRDSPANDLKEDEVTTIIATLDFFQINKNYLRQCVYDLRGPPRFRVFDWLAMGLFGRLEGYGEDDGELARAKMIIKKMTEIYLEAKGVHKFINELRVRDLQIELNYF